MDERFSLELGNLFMTQAQAIVVPVSTAGTISELIKNELENRFGKGYADTLAPHPLGDLDIHFFTNQSGQYEKTISIIFATCVDNGRSDLQTISTIAQKLGSLNLQNRKITTIACPLLGTGAGRLDPLKVYREIKRAFLRTATNDLKLQIYTMDESIFTHILANEEPLITQVEPFESYTGHEGIPNEDDLRNPQVPSHKLYSEDFINGRTCYFAEGYIDGTDESHLFYTNGIWQLRDGNAKSNVANVGVGSLLILKNNLRQSNKNNLQVMAVGVVTGAASNNSTLKVDWQVRKLAVDFPQYANHASRLERIKNSVARTIFTKINVLDLTTSDIASPQPLIETETLGQVSHIAGLISDTENGEDYLSISQDVLAFSKIMASKAFQPPLAIALLGKWGSGKSFFMRKLQVQVDSLSNYDQQLYCSGVAHIHFNAWSYLDANLWASIVSRIFEQLSIYFGANTEDKKITQEIEQKLNEQLRLVTDQVQLINEKKTEVLNAQADIQQKRDDLQKKLKTKLESVGKASLKAALEAVDKQFDAKKQIGVALNENKAFKSSKEELEKIIPKEYLEDPEKAYEKAKSIVTFVRAFFKRDKIIWNLIYLAGVITIIRFLPVWLSGFTDWLKKNDFSIPSFQMISAGVLIVFPIWNRVLAFYKEWQPMVAGLWKVKTNYRAQVADARLQHHQNEKQMEMDIQMSVSQLAVLDQQLQQTQATIMELEFRIKRAIGTEALYTFIEKRYQSDDYRKHLGIVSIIRNDFEVLSKLFVNGSKEELEKVPIHKLKRPLQRIILYIDDLDRCPQERVIEVLEAVNLLMAFPLFVVVVGVDPVWVKNSLHFRYGEQFGKAGDKKKTGNIEPGDYLEKIFQIPFHLKSANDTQVKNMLKTLSQPNPAYLATLNASTAQPIVEKMIIAEDTNEIGPIVEEESSEPADDLNAEMIQHDEHLVLNEKEITLMQQLSGVIGNNPRAIKRFVNIYQIIRAHEGFSLNEQTSDEEFLNVMFLVALYTGRFRKLTSNFSESIYISDLSRLTLSEYCNKLYEPEINQMKMALLEVLKEPDQAPILELKLNSFITHEAFIHRFSFEQVA